MTPALSVRGATKRFGAVLALDAVDLDVAPRRGLALLGDNGAGKSTLIKCISGVHRLDAGDDRDRRRAGDDHSPAAAQAARHRDRVPRPRPVRQSRPGGELLRRPRGRRTALAAAPAARASPPSDGSTRRPTCSSVCRSRCPTASAAVGLMSGGQRQVIAVARAAAFASKVVILDEPTAALGLRESRRVLDLILRLRDEGHAVIVISHAMDHVTEVADRAVVMRRGRKVGEEVPEPREPAADRRADRRHVSGACRQSHNHQSGTAGHRETSTLPDPGRHANGTRRTSQGEK